MASGRGSAFGGSSVFGSEPFAGIQAMEITQNEPALPAAKRENLKPISIKFAWDATTAKEPIEGKTVQELANNLLSYFANLPCEEFTHGALLFSYADSLHQGFNAATIQAVLLQIAQQKGDRELITKVIHICLVLLARTPNPRKLIDHSTKEVSDLIKKFCDDYGVKVLAKGQAPPKNKPKVKIDEVTLARIPAAFPDIAWIVSSSIGKEARIVGGAIDYNVYKAPAQLQHSACYRATGLYILQKKTNLIKWLAPMALYGQLELAYAVNKDADRPRAIEQVFGFLISAKSFNGARVVHLDSLKTTRASEPPEDVDYERVWGMLSDGIKHGRINYTMDKFCDEVAKIVSHYCE